MRSRNSGGVASKGHTQLQPPCGRQHTFRASTVEEKGLSAPELDCGAGTAWDPVWMLPEGRGSLAPSPVCSSLRSLLSKQLKRVWLLLPLLEVPAFCKREKRKGGRFRGGLWAQESRPDRQCPSSGLASPDGPGSGPVLPAERKAL